MRPEAGTNGTRYDAPSGEFVANHVPYARLRWDATGTRGRGNASPLRLKRKRRNGRAGGGLGPPRGERDAL